MAYAAPVDTGQHIYTMTFTHIATGIFFNCTMGDTGGVTDAQRDSVFQAFVNNIASFGPTVVTINSANKSGTYSIAVTSP